MRAMRRACDDASLGILPYHPRHIFTEQYEVVVPGVVLNLILAAVAVAIVLPIMVKHPITAAVVLVMVGLVDIGLFAVMYIADIQVNSVSLINLVVSIGAAVDYSAHVGHAFMVLPGNVDRLQRTTFALTHIGKSVFFGAVSSIIGILPLALSKSAIFRTFFNMYFGLLCLALLHGLVLLPVVLRFIGPRGAFCCSLAGNDSDDDNDDNE